MTAKSSRPALALLLLAAVCAQQSLSASTTTPSFIISAGTTTLERSPVMPSQAFSKQWMISGDTDGQIAAIEALALDLPGQVFITYEAAPTNESLTKEIGSIKVFGETEASIDAVSVVTKRAMRGAKLAVSSTQSPALKPTANIGSSSSTVPGTLLTEVVLLRKAALKKIITNGWADVVISDDVLFSKRKEDYSFMFNRALRVAADAADNASSITFTETQREIVPRGIGPQIVNPNWTILTPTSGALDTVSLDVQVVSSGFTELIRVDSDFLPDGAIGMVAAVNGNVTVASTRSTDGHETLVVTSKTVNASVAINLAAAVKVGSITPRFQAGSGIMAHNLNKTFPDDALAVLLNGSGNVFVLANNSAVYVRTATFQVSGSGFMQLEIDAMHAPDDVMIRKDYFDSLSGAYEVLTGFVVLKDMACRWGPSSYLSSMTKKISDAADAQGKSPRCPIAAVPKKVGGSKSSSSSAPSSGSSTPSSGSSKGNGSAASRSTGVSFFGVALTIGAVLVAAMS